MTVNNSETPAASIGQFLVIAGLIILYGFGSFWVCAELIKGGEDKDKIPMYIQYGVPVLFAGIGYFLNSESQNASTIFCFFRHKKNILNVKKKLNLKYSDYQDISNDFV